MEISWVWTLPCTKLMLTLEMSIIQVRYKCFSAYRRGHEDINLRYMHVHSRSTLQNSAPYYPKLFYKNILHSTCSEIGYHLYFLYGEKTNFHISITRELNFTSGFTHFKLNIYREETEITGSFLNFFATQLWLHTVVPMDLNFATFSKDLIVILLKVQLHQIDDKSNFYDNFQKQNTKRYI